MNNDDVLIPIYGKPFVEAAKKYLEDHTDNSFSTFVDAEINLSTIYGKKDHSIVTEIYNDERKAAFLAGCIYASKHKDDSISSENLI